jgi:group I intron endonuclease
MLIYEAYNTKNGKSYIGLTTTSLKKRKSQHLRSAKSGSNMHFHKAIRKHGPEVFEWSVVAKCSTLDRLYKLEQMIISLYEVWQIYNKSTGGEHSAMGMKHTEETKALCKEHGLRRWDSKRALDIWPEECFNTQSYKEAKAVYGIPKTTWYRVRKQMNKEN